MTQLSALSIDQFDRKILNLVQESNRIISDHIAEKVGLSPAAVQRRLKRMRDQNIINADISVVNPKAVGRPMTFIVQVSLECERADLLDSFKRDIKQHQSVQQCYYVTGSMGFILIVNATDMEDYENFTRKAFFGNKKVRSFETNVVMDAVKVGLSVPLDT